MIHLGDVTKISGYDIPPVDVITGGSPCQDLSVAGHRAGLAGERSGLFMEQIRIVKEMRERDRQNGRSDALIRPRFLVWENVPGAFSSNAGRDFQAVLSEIVRIIEPEAPDVPMPDRGGVEQGRMPRRCAGKILRCLATSRRAVLGSAPAKETNRTCRRFWRPRRTRSTI